MSGFAEDLICKICHQLLRDPHIMPCGHSYCLHPCILKTTTANTVFCPQCYIEGDVSLLVPDESTHKRICMELRRRMSENANNQIPTPSKPADPASAPSECAECKAQSFGALTCLHCARRLCSNCQQKHIAMVICNLTQRIRAIRASTQTLETIQINLLIQDNKESPQRSALNCQLDNAVEDLELACERTFGGAILKLTEAANEVQGGLTKQLAGIAEIKRIAEFAAVLPAVVDSNEDSLDELLLRRRELSDVLKSYYKLAEFPATVNAEKVDISKEALDEVGRRLEEFDFLIVGKSPDDTEDYHKEVPSQKLHSTSSNFPQSSEPLASPKQLDTFSSEPTNFA